MKELLLMLATLTAVANAQAATPAQTDWRGTVEDALPLLGHRNWIIIADSAFPHQISPGVQTVYTGEDQIVVLETVMKMLSKTSHVNPLVYLDAELKHVPETRAPGIEAYRVALKRSLGARPATEILHEDVLRKIDQTGKMYKVLMLKTNMTLPYTSVFLELDCGYWGPEAEKAMRASMGGKGAAVTGKPAATKPARTRRKKT